MFCFFTDINGISTQQDTTETATDLYTTEQIQTSTDQIQITTEEIQITTENLEQKTNLTQTIARQTRSQNLTLDDVAFDEDDEKPTITNLNKNKPLVSASKVIEAINDPDNNINLSNAKKNPVKELKDEELRALINRNKKNNIRAHVQYDEVTGELMGGDHPCQRECKEGEEPMICYYHFNLEWYQTMSKACYDCPYNETDCMRPDCIPADGMNRALNVVNRKMPGPAIEVSSLDKFDLQW